MRFDDRLATVLRHRAAGARAARTQFRQLLDLLDAPRESRDSSLLAAGWLRLGALGEAIPAAERAAILRDPSVRIRSPELAIHLAEDEPEVSAAALSRASLSPDDWDALIPRLPIRARGFLRLRRDLPEGTVTLLERLGIHDRGLPQPEAVEAAVPDQAPLAPEPVEPSPEGAQEEPEDSEIGALVKRIEAFRVARHANTPDHGDAPRLPLGDRAPATERKAATGFGFTADTEGRIDWADPQVAPSVVGMRLADCFSADAPALPLRLPLQGQLAEVTGAPGVAGAWLVDAAPRFSDATGAFTGYAGRFRRPVEAAANDSTGGDSEGDRMRQLLHELRTPVNAIQGYAEVIQQQLFGQVPHEYRAIAATVAGDAARIMAGFDEMDRLARLETGAFEIDPGACDLCAVVTRQLAMLGPVIEPRMAAIEARIAPPPCPVALSQQAAEALVWRMLATLAGAAGAGERMQLTLDRTSREVLLGCEIPAGLAGEHDIFSATARASSGALSAGAFGAGFALRLVRAEARAIGGSLARVDDVLLLVLPLLTGIEAVPSPANGAGGNAGQV
ncbi:MAG: sensor histidine kinase [Sphingomonadaceae bacterium]|nr:sensor histidine kinase [Sphingomonadaceae bacterium]